MSDSVLENDSSSVHCCGQWRMRKMRSGWADRGGEVVSGPVKSCCDCYSGWQLGRFVSLISLQLAWLWFKEKQLSVQKASEKKEIYKTIFLWVIWRPSGMVTITALFSAHVIVAARLFPSYMECERRKDCMSWGSYKNKVALLGFLVRLEQIDPCSLVFRVSLKLEIAAWWRLEDLPSGKNDHKHEYIFIKSSHEEVELKTNSNESLVFDVF